MIPRVLGPYPSYAGTPFQPCNGTGMMVFTDVFCDRCLNMHPDPEKKPKCEILMYTMIRSPGDKEYPTEWIYDREGWPVCTAWQKWDWGNDDDDWNEPPEEPDPDPNQLMMFPFWEGMPFADEKVVATRHAIFEVSDA